MINFALLAMWNPGIGPKKGGKGVIWGKSRGDTQHTFRIRIPGSTSRFDHFQIPISGFRLGVPAAI